MRGIFTWGGKPSSTWTWTVLFSLRIFLKAAKPNRWPKPSPGLRSSAMLAFTPEFSETLTHESLWQWAMLPNQTVSNSHWGCCQWAIQYLKWGKGIHTRLLYDTQAAMQREIWQVKSRQLFEQLRLDLNHINKVYVRIIPRFLLEDSITLSLVYHFIGRPKSSKSFLVSDTLPESAYSLFLSTPSCKVLGIN